MPLALRVHRQDAQPCRGRSVANDDAGEAGIERQRPFRCLGDIAGCALETSAVSGEVKTASTVKSVKPERLWRGMALNVFQ